MLQSSIVEELLGNLKTSETTADSSLVLDFVPE